MRNLSVTEIQRVSGGTDPTLEPPLQPGWPNLGGGGLGQGYGGYNPEEENQSIDPDDVVNTVQIGVYVDRQGDGIYDMHLYPGATVWGEDLDGNGYVDWFEDGFANGSGGTADFDGVQIWFDNIS